MNIEKFSLGQLQANCYLLKADRDCIIIDPADEASFILEEISRQNLTLHGMLATHGHFDHVMAAGEIQLSLPVPLFLGQKDAFLIRRLGETARHFLGYEPYILPPSILKNAKAGALEIGPFNLQIIETPGHTPGGVSYYFKEEQAVFTGDTLFAGSVGRTDLSYSRPLDLAASLTRLYGLPEETAVYPGHGEETSVLNEKTRSAKL